MRQRMKEEKAIKEGHIKILFFAALLVMLGGIHLAIPDFYSTIWNLSVSGNMDGTIVYLQSFGVWAVFVSMFIDIVINIVGFLPSIFISTANGVIFGIFGGTIISWIAETVGVVISFFFMRTLFRSKAKQLIEKSRMLSKLDEYSTMKSMMIARALPYSPNGLITALGALSRITYRDYIIGTLIGKLPSVAIEVIVGHDIVMMKENADRLTVLIVAIIVVYGGFWYWHRRRKAKAVLKQLQQRLSDEETHQKKR